MRVNSDRELKVLCMRTCGRLHDLDTRENRFPGLGIGAACQELCRSGIDHDIKIGSGYDRSNVRRGGARTYAVACRALGPTYPNNQGSVKHDSCTYQPKEIANRSPEGFLNSYRG